MSPFDPARYEALERIFHEPNRLAIMSNLCAADDGMNFTELRNICNMTDGNLNRHLKVLEEANTIKIDKQFVDNKPRTTIRLSSTGLTRFNEYLTALSDVLKQAQAAMPTTAKAKDRPLRGLRPAAI